MQCQVLDYQSPEWFRTVRTAIGDIVYISSYIIGAIWFLNGTMGPPTMVSVGHDMFYRTIGQLECDTISTIFQSLRCSLIDNSFVDEIISTPPELL